MANKNAPGRKGRKGLKRTDNYIINEFGVKISHDEARQLRNAVAAANRKAAKMEKEFKGQPLFFGKRQLEENREQLKMMGEEMDIMIRKRSASLNQFQTRGEFTKYLKSAEHVRRVDYLDWRGKLYKRNLIKAIQNEYGEYPDLVKGIITRIQMMPQKKFQKLIGENRAFQISYQYSVDKKISQIMAMRETLNLRSAYDDYDF